MVGREAIAGSEWLSLSVILDSPPIYGQRLPRNDRRRPFGVEFVPPGCAHGVPLCRIPQQVDNGCR
jgi:hypothetical protein